MKEEIMDTPALKNLDSDTAVAMGEMSDKVLSGTYEWLQSAEEFAVEQAPLLIEEILMYQTFEHAFFFGLGLLLILVGIPLCLYSRSKVETDDRDQPKHALPVIMTIVGGVMPVPGILMVTHEVQNLAKIYLAPRLYLIEYFKEFVT